MKKLILLTFLMLTLAACNKSTKEELIEAEETTEELTINDNAEPQTALFKDKTDYTYDVTYEMLARNPYDYINEPVKFTGTISQIVTVNDYGYNGFRMSVDNDDNLNLLVIYEEDIIGFDLLENDNVTIYAEYLKQYSYESVSEETITVPLVCATMIDLNDNSLVSNYSLELPILPINTSYKNQVDGSTETTVRIENVKYKFEKNYNDGTYYLTLILAGTKTYEKENLNMAFNGCSYKLYDEDENIVASGEIYFGYINVGDELKDVTETIYDLPNGNYRLELSDYLDH